MIRRTIRGPPNPQTGSTSKQLTPKAPYKPAPAKAGVISHAFGERAVLKPMYAALIRAAERWRGFRMTEFEPAMTGLDPPARQDVSEFCHVHGRSSLM